MQHRTFSGASEREALDMAKENLGDDILIVNMSRNKYAEEGMQVTVTVIADETTHLELPYPFPKPEPTRPFPWPKQVDPNPVAHRIPVRPHPLYNNPAATLARPVAPKPIDPVDVRQMGELFLLRKQLLDLKAQVRTDKGNPFSEPFKYCFDMISEAGVPDHIAERLVQITVNKLSRKKSVTRHSAMTEMAKQIRKQLAPKKRKKRSGQEIIVLVGPSGAGKTTLIAKLAASKKGFRGKRVGIISTDIYRAGANAGLKSISRILDAPVIEVKRVDDIPRAIANLVDYDVILVDTPGRSPLSKGSLPELQTQIALLNPTETLLVLSANMGIEELWLFAGLYKALQPTGLVITKLDETSKPGKVLGLVDDSQMPLMYVTNGQAIPHSLQTDPGKAIVECLPLNIKNGNAID